MEGPRRLTPLHLSVSYKAAAAVRILTSFGADVDAVDGAGMTPLHMAAGILDQDVLVCLLHQGADINKVSDVSLFCCTLQVKHRVLKGFWTF